MRTLSIFAVEAITPRAYAIRLALGSDPFEDRAGQAVRVRGIASPTSRWYSIATCPGESARQGWIELLVGKADWRGRGAWSPFDSGDLVEIEGPTGNLTLMRDSSHTRVVFIAGGTGIAPLRALLHEAIAAGHQDLALAYSGRTPADLAYRQEFLQLSRSGQIELMETVTRSAGDQWTGRHGRFGAATLAPLVTRPDSEYFLCGPGAFVMETAAHLNALGVPAARMHADLPCPPTPVETRPGSQLDTRPDLQPNIASRS